MRRLWHDGRVELIQSRWNDFRCCAADCDLLSDLGTCEVGHTMVPFLVLLRLGGAEGGQTTRSGPLRRPFDPPGSCGAADSVGVQNGDGFPPDSSRSGLVKSPRTLTNSSSRSWPPDRPRCVQPVTGTPRNRSVSRVWSGSAKLPWNTVENPVRAAIGQKWAKVQEVCDKSEGSCPPERVVRVLHAAQGVRDGSGRLGVCVGAHETGDCRRMSRRAWWRRGRVVGCASCGGWAAVLTVLGCLRTGGVGVGEV